MRAEDIVEGLNKHIEDKRKLDSIPAKGHLVLQSTATTHPTFKVYKTCEATLWFIKDNRKHKILSVQHTDRVLNKQESNIERAVNIELCRVIFNWVGSNSYIQVINGEYRDYGSDNRTE